MREMTYIQFVLDKDSKSLKGNLVKSIDNFEVSSAWYEIQITTPPRSEVKTSDLYELKLSMVDGNGGFPKLAKRESHMIPKKDVNV